MKEISSKITYKDKDYKMVFNLNVIEKIQEVYGTLDKWGSLTDGKDTGETDVKALVFGITEMINEAIDIDNDENGTQDPFLTHKQVSRILTSIGIEKATKEMNELVVNATKDEESESSKNA